MDRVTSRLTVFFDGTFWVGIFERIEGGALSAAKVTFGAEPRDCEICALILKEYGRLRFSPAVTAAVGEMSRNPKRIQRQIRRQLQDTGTGTKSQQALKMQQEQMKTVRREKTREQKEREKERKFQMKRRKKREKHRGR